MVGWTFTRTLTPVLMTLNGSLQLRPDKSDVRRPYYSLTHRSRSTSSTMYCVVCKLNVSTHALRPSTIAKICLLKDCCNVFPQFLPRDVIHKRGLCRHAVSVRRSVHLSVTFVDHVETNKHIFEIFSPSGSHTILVFRYHRGCRYSDGNPPNGGIECRWGIVRNRDSGLIAGYRILLDVRSAKNISGRRSWVYDTVGHAPLAIDRLLDARTRSDKNSYRKPCSVDRIVGDVPSNVCLWRPGAWTNTPKRREQKRI